MKIFLHEITDQELELHLTQEEAWVVNAVMQVDENGEGSTKAPARPVEAHLSLRQVDNVVVVSGKIDTYVELVCSRCANRFRLPCKPSFSALFCKDPVMAGVGHLHPTMPGHRDSGRPMGQNQGFARHAHNEEEDAYSEGKDLDITYLSHDYIDLSEVLTEQLRFQVPFQPLCKEDCKGICSQCGTDFNQGRCACAKILSSQPFSVLNDYKI